MNETVPTVTNAPWFPAKGEFPAPVEVIPGIGQIHAAIAAIMAEVGGVGKTRKNEQQGYKFRGIADIKLACQPLLAKHGVHLTPHVVLHEEVNERTTAKGGTMLHIRQRIEFRYYHRDGSFFSCVTTGEAMDSGDKASSKCMSAAMKYALDQVFCLPEEDPEADTENASPELGAKKKTEPATTAAQVAAHVNLPAAEALTDMDILRISGLAKRAGYKLREELKPVLREIAGVESLRLFPRKFLDDLTAFLESKGDATMTKDVDEMFPEKA